MGFLLLLVVTIGYEDVGEENEVPTFLDQTGVRGANFVVDPVAPQLVDGGLHVTRRISMEDSVSVGSRDPRLVNGTRFMMSARRASRVICENSSVWTGNWRGC